MSKSSGLSLYNWAPVSHFYTNQGCLQQKQSWLYFWKPYSKKTMISPVSPWPSQWRKWWVEGEGLLMTLTGKEVAQAYQGRPVHRPHWKPSASPVPPPKRIYLGLLGGPIHTASPRSGQGLKRWDFLPTNPVAMVIRDHGFKRCCSLGLPWWRSG